MPEEAFNLIILGIYLLLAGIILVKGIISKISLYKHANDAEENSDKNISVCTVRNQYFPVELPSKDFFISSYMEETFNIFIKLAPSMISTLSKAERRILAIKSGIDNPIMTKALLISEINDIECSLNDMIKVSHAMIEKLEESVSKEHSDNSLSQLDPTAVRAYMDSVNVLVDLTDSHATINYETHSLLLDKYPELIEPFRVIVSKFTYLLFINLISYSNKIDQNLFMYV